MAYSELDREPDTGSLALSVAQAGFVPSFEIASLAYWDPAVSSYSALVPPTVELGQEIGLEVRLRNTKEFPCYYAVWMGITLPDGTWTNPMMYQGLPGPTYSWWERLLVSGGPGDDATFSAPWKFKFTAEQPGRYHAAIWVYSESTYDLLLATLEYTYRLGGGFYLADVEHLLAGSISSIWYHDPRSPFTNKWVSTMPDLYLNESLQVLIYPLNSSTAPIIAKAKIECTKPSGVVVTILSAEAEIGLDAEVYCFQFRVGSDSAVLLDEAGNWAFQATLSGRIK